MDRARWLAGGPLVGFAALFFVLGCDDGTRPMLMDDPDAGTSTADDGGTPRTGSDAGPAASGSTEPGGACSCDAECAGTGTHPGVCLQGICMTRASAACASAGSSAECPTGSRCWGLEGVDGGICWPDCDAHGCDGACDEDGSCVPSESSTCDASCSAICTDDSGGSCPPNAHPEGDGCVCDEGFVVNEARDGCVPACEGPADFAGDLVCEDGRCVAPPCT
ncbi:MAG TPA: hypothetical protein RMH99_16120, partial [Sandaracinaceae bacterium LLY-WYZ-13_1]|nr:hypothetical protein [Sandaracinaceae bacterium LLY-WYZ-13_1]